MEKVVLTTLENSSKLCIKIVKNKDAETEKINRKGDSYRIVYFTFVLREAAKKVLLLMAGRLRPLRKELFFAPSFIKS